MTTEHKTLAVALAAFQAEMPKVHKGKTAKVPTKSGGSYSYDYADLADVSAATMPLLTKHGLSFITRPEAGERGWQLTGVLLHASGETIEGALPIDGNTPQAWGSALTYMRRYLMGCLTGIVTDDDEDGALASRPVPRPQQQPRPPQAPPGAPVGDGTPITDKTRKQMFALFTKRGIGEEQQLPGINHVTGKQYESRADLTEEDARRVVAHLNGEVIVEAEGEA